MASAVHSVLEASLMGRGLPAPEQDDVAEGVHRRYWPSLEEFRWLYIRTT